MQRLMAVKYHAIILRLDSLVPHLPYKAVIHLLYHFWRCGTLSAEEAAEKETSWTNEQQWTSKTRELQLVLTRTIAEFIGMNIFMLFVSLFYGQYMSNRT